MSGLPSVADILLLSQLAWRIGRAFVSGNTNAPQEFHEIESQVQSLSKSLKLLAELLFDSNDDHVLAIASDETKEGVCRLLFSCHQTLQDLDSLIAEHQTTVKKNTDGGGFSVERSWSPMVLANHKYMMWTSDGGNLQALRDILQMHVNSLRLVVQAVQEKSHDNVEFAIHTLPERIGSPSRLPGSALPVDDNMSMSNVSMSNESISNLSMSNMSMSIMSMSELQAQVDEVANQYSRFEIPAMTLGETDSVATLDEDEGSVPPPPPRNAKRRFSRTNSSEKPRAEDLKSPSSMPPPSIPPSPGRPHSVKSFGSAAISPRDPRFNALSRDSGTYQRPLTPSAASIARQASISSRYSDRSMALAQRSPTAPEPDRPDLMATTRASSIISMDPLPPAAFNDMEIDTGSSIDLGMSGLSLGARLATSSVNFEGQTASAQQQYAFEKEAFKNGAILCDVRGVTVEYTRENKSENERDPSNPFSVELIQAMGSCRICIVRKREATPSKEVQLVTTIWAFSEDGSIRLEHKLQDGAQYIPYTSFFSPEKVALTVPTELRYHDVVYGSRIVDSAATNWVNYIIADAKGAALFQNELMSRILLASFKTEKTTRIHEGFSSVLAYEEQMCGMENLRLWEDETSRGVFAMVHFSAQFRNGYFAFWLNSSLAPVRIKDNGGKEIKIKGLRIFLGEDKGKGRATPSDLQRRDSATSRRGSENKRYITGAKMEFSSEVEKFSFLELVHEIQTSLVPLPELG